MQKQILLILRNYSKIPYTLKGRKKASQEWLVRQFKDPYVEKAKKENFRCRSSFKLLEINEKHKILTYGCTVLDIGCAPGSWSQVCIRAVNSDGFDKTKPKGIVIGLDRLPIYPLEGVTFFGNTDFTTNEAKMKILKTLNGAKVNCVLSDMAPNATGIRSLDQEQIMNLAHEVFNFAKEVSAEKASLLVKVWDNGEVGKFVNMLREHYETCKHVKPNASRSDSAELFILAKGFKGLQKIKHHM
ncbi:hypothetical protein PVAND_009115 [Polypedilum vanderplanki]|uniref:rRNA methyltransferase 2, mitochondrial n=1 Tax=Polypedilum vanderplanki TaxID=319348 RepID=A0A9J6CCS9_POLVA|nr:hypothetical protein PVAND_009115 [Polypedilum vanderplanki]